MIRENLQTALAAWGFFMIAGIVFLGNFYGNRQIANGELPALFGESRRDGPMPLWKRVAIRVHYCFAILAGVAAALMGIFALYVSVVTLLILAGIV